GFAGRSNYYGHINIGLDHANRQNETHTFSSVSGERFRGPTLCLQPSEKTQFLNIQFSSGTIVDHV
ncbi:MAG: hypothetical protein L7T85_01395, partial [Flavobacteriaceae bacterium]|nr:hypothetical protein [Flavobacteriaceae bacterium]